jgi:Uma2 family endonuclease
VADLAAITDHDRLEIIGGEIVEKAAPSPGHSRGAARLAGMFYPFDRKPGGRGPGGWWIHVEIHVAYPNGETYCHDLAGWRREHVPEPLTGWPVQTRPDWVCEITSPNHEKRDFVDKLATLHAAGVPHYWILHPEQQMLLVYRWADAGYLTVLTATAGQKLRIEPFGAIEIEVGVLFGDDPSDDTA